MDKKIDRTPMESGKYRGQTPDTVADVDPKYMKDAYERAPSGNKPCSYALYTACCDEVATINREDRVEDDDDCAERFTR